VILINSNKKRDHWIATIGAQKSSGLPQAKWCKANDISLHTLRYWVNKLNSTEQSVDSSQEFIPIIPRKQNNESAIEISVGSVIIKVSDSFCSETLNKIMKVLVHYV
jgi:hypothetical protein